MLDTVEQSIHQHNMVGPGDIVLVALSGGADSVAALLCLHRLSPKLDFNLMAVYINHRLRPKAARQEEQFCSELCDGLGVELKIVREDVHALAEQWKVGVEEAGRRLRYATFEQLADEYGCSRVATGHHADDQIETVLFRVLRGTGTAGLAGIPPVRGRIIRPLLNCTRQQIVEYLSDQGVTFCEDRSNRDLRFSRNFLRHQLLPEIRQRINSNVDEALLTLARNAADSEAVVARVVDDIVDRLVSWTAGGKLRLALDPLRRYDEPVERRVLRYCLSLLSPENSAPDRETVERLARIGREGGKGLSLPGGLEARLVGEDLFIFRRDRLVFECTLDYGDRCRLDMPMLTIRCSRKWKFDGRLSRKRRSTLVTVDADRVHGPLTVRSIRRGDRFRPLGSRGSKKVSEYLTDRKVPPVLRDEIPVVCDSKGIIWLVGFEIADRVKVDERTTEVVNLGIDEQRRAKTEVV